MTTIVNHAPTPLVNYPVDFAWYSTTALSILEDQIGTVNFPYGLTTTTSNFTTPSNTTTGFTIPVASASTFVGGSGTNPAGTSYQIMQGQYPFPIGFLYITTSTTNWALIGYTLTSSGGSPISVNTFQSCFVINGYNNGTGLTFPSGTTIFDPRWISYTLPLSTFTTTSVTFDAMDTLNQGMPSSKLANIVSFHWDLGNGTTADGPVVETQYWFTGSLNYPGGNLAAPTEIKVTLTAIDINGNVYYVTHPITFSDLYGSVGGAFTPAYEAHT